MFFDVLKSKKLFLVTDVAINDDLTLSIDLFEPVLQDSIVMKLKRLAVIDKGSIQIYQPTSNKSFMYGYILAKIRDAFRRSLYSRTIDISEKLDVPVSGDNQDYWIKRSVNSDDYLKLISDKYEVWQYTGTLIGAPQWLEERINAYEFKLIDDDSKDKFNENIISSQTEQKIVSPNNYFVINKSTNIIRVLSESSYQKFIQDYGMFAWLDNH